MAKVSKLRISFTVFGRIMTGIGGEAGQEILERKPPFARTPCEGDREEWITHDGGQPVCMYYLMSFSNLSILL